LAKTLPVQTIAKPTLIAQQEIDEEDSNPTVLIADNNITIKKCHQLIRKPTSRRWPWMAVGIGLQDPSRTLLCSAVSIFATMKDAVLGSDIMATVGNWQLKVDLQEP
jgi:hypothetical protein